MKKPSFLLSACVALALTATTTFAAKPEVGKEAPDFKLTDSAGKEHSLTDFKGKYVVLEWTNPGCPFVRKHYKSGNMQKLQAMATEKGAVWLAIDSSASGKEGYLSGAEAKKAKEGDYKNASALLIDADGKVGKLYSATNTPEMAIINPEGKVVYTGAIDSISSADEGDIAKATNYVQVGLEEAMAGKAVTKSSSKPYGCGVKY